MKCKFLSLIFIISLSMILSSCSGSNNTSTATQDSTIPAASINSTQTITQGQGKTIPEIDYKNAKLPGDPQSWIESTTPRYDERNVDPGSNISITFKYDMDPETLNEKNIIIDEGKHSRTITELYNFKYDKEARALNIDFKIPGNNVGTGNGITIYLSKNIKNLEGISMGFDMVFGYSTKYKEVI